ncbi:ATPase DNA packaging protein [Adoxophyes honmai entomopoxvirus 'L' virophage 1]|nr:ATPase DNA packaging protein [Adoxophyes honmai entomopoxvirus 'L' virophage 1]
MGIINYNEKYGYVEKTRYYEHFPNTFRCLINGESGSGKTNILINIMNELMEKYKKNDVNFCITICSKTLDQSLYKGFIDETNKNYDGFGRVDTVEEIKKFDDKYYNSDKNIKKIIIIDDMIGKVDKEDKKALIHLFTASRPREICVFFLTQRYTHLDVVCRQQCNYIVSFRQGINDLRLIYQEKLNFLPSFELLQDMYMENSTINFFCLFCDLDRCVVKNCIEIFHHNMEIMYYNNPRDLVVKFRILEQEMYAGNDNDSIIDNIKLIISELYKMNIIF